MAEPGQTAEMHVAAAYEQYLVPRLYEPWGMVLIERLALKPGETLVDVSCGPGTLARIAALKLTGTGRVIATDTSSAMLLLAHQRTGLPGVAPIDYREGPAVPLPVPDGVADAVACQQGLSDFPDMPSAFQQMRRILKPGGRLAASAWTDISGSNLFSAVYVALKDAGPPGLAELWRKRFSGPAEPDLKAWAEGAGFYDVRVERLSLTVTFEGGPPQVFASLAGTSVAPGLASLTERERLELREVVAKKVGPLVKNKTVEGRTAAHVVLARR
jgi:ubiquinone/menaquinone biosynthesis C-methylase UbiE